MSEIWAIAENGRIVNGTNADSEVCAWNCFYFTYFLASEMELMMEEFIEGQKRRGYSAVRLKYEIVERDGEGK